jgi:gamma-butyrobetaine dioxygenase
MEFAAGPFAADAVTVRRWDEAAKDPSAAIPPFEHFAPLLTRVVRPTLPPS